MLLMMAVAGLLAAQPTSTTLDPITCMSDVYWTADPAEVAAIESDPVPPSFRRTEPLWSCHGRDIESSVRFLYDWHVNFGTERSIAGAFDYLERRALREPNVPADRAETALSVARHEVRAAEEFGSMALLVRGERLLATVPLNTADAEQQLSIDDTAIRAAILRARLTRSPADLTRARALVDATERPAYRNLVPTILPEGQELCDDSDEAPGGAECKAEQDRDRRVVLWALNRAMLDAFVLDDPADDLEPQRMSYLFERAEGRLTGECCSISYRDDFLRLYLATSDGHRRRLELGESADRRYADVMGGLGDLQNAANITTPYDSPARFKRIATAWLSLWSFARHLPDALSRQYANRASQLRYATYLRAMIANVDAIATAAH